MAEVEAVAVAYDMVSPYGWGVAPCWEGLFSGETAIRRFDRFSTESLRTDKAALVPGLDPNADETLVMQMVRPLLEKPVSGFPADALLLLATTNGEIDVLERSVLHGTADASGSRPDLLASKIQNLCGLDEPGVVICAACASSSAAVAQGAAMIRDGDRDCVLVVACDNVSEFVAAGFSSLMALDKDMARPFDRNRRGLSLGEAAAFVLLMSDERASSGRAARVGRGRGMESHERCQPHHRAGAGREWPGPCSSQGTAIGRNHPGGSRKHIGSWHGDGIQ